jgi:pimeloyl-ACP methyl ester carboxylesterase
MAGLHLEPFTPPADPAALADLHDRLRATRWPDQPPAADDWAMGADVGYLRELVTSWADADVHGLEARLVTQPHFRTEMAGRRVHLLHARAAEGSPTPLPLLLAHGWPDSHWRYAKVIPLLTDPAAHGGDPADAFDVVVPDMPGYGYSEAPADGPIDAIAVAAMWAELMSGLGYDRYLTAGGDIGSHVARYLALDDPEHVVAVHRMDAGLPVPGAIPDDLTAEERTWIDDATAWGATEGAYAQMHRTKPQTAAVGLTDSPAGLAAWIVEKLRSWSDCDGDLERVYRRDELLVLLSQYWFTGTIASSMRMYLANGAIPAEQRMRRVQVPSGYSLFAGDIAHPPRAWLERTSDLRFLREHDRGGHFAPFEDPETYARDLRDFFRPFRQV